MPSDNARNAAGGFGSRSTAASFAFAVKPIRESRLAGPHKKARLHSTAIVHAVPRTHGQFLDLRRHNDAIQMIGLAIELDRGADVKAKVRR